MSKEMKRFENGEVAVIQYSPVGSGNEFQKKITQLMSEVIEARGDTTLAEMGYLHMNMVSYVENRVELKVYFAPELATITTGAFNGAPVVKPNPALNVFKDYLFVGSLEQAIGFDTMAVPKYKIKENEYGRRYINIKDGCTMEDSEVLVLYCNLPIALAATNRIPLSDPNYDVTYQTVGAAGGKHPERKVIISVGSKQEFPVRIEATYTARGERYYDPADAVPYLIARANRANNIKKNQKKLAKKVSEEAADMKTAQTAKVYNSYLKYR